MINRRPNWEKVVYVKEAVFILDNIVTRKLRTNKILGGKYHLPHQSYLYLDGDIFYSSVDMRDYDKLVLKNLNGLDVMYRTAYRIVNKFAKTDSRFNPLEIKNLTNRELVEKFKNYCLRYQDALSSLYLPAALDRVLSKILRTYLEKKYPLQARQYFNDLTGLIKDGHDMVAYHNLLLINSHLGGRRLINFAKSAAEKYGFLGIKFYLGKIYDYKDVLKHWKNLRTKEFLKHEKEKIEIKKAEQNRYRKTLAIVRPNRGVRQLIRNLQEAIFFRTYRLERICEGEANSFVLLGEIAKRIGLSQYEIVLLRVDEIVSYLLCNKIFPKFEISKRCQPFGMFFYDRKCKFYFSKDYLKFARRYRLKNETTTTIKGQIAFPGLIRGIACIVKTDEELKKLKKGQILIAKMTTPDYIFAMQMSAAVVTDFGGVTSHASVVSRELAKPCVIGTGNATSVFKDGDVVEVDANRGIVKIIK